MRHLILLFTLFSYFLLSADEAHYFYRNHKKVFLIPDYQNISFIKNKPIRSITFKNNPIQPVQILNNVMLFRGISENMRSSLSQQGFIIPAYKPENGRIFRFVTNKLYIKIPEYLHKKDIAGWLKIHNLKEASPLLLDNWIYVETSENPIHKARELYEKGIVETIEPSFFVQTELYSIDPITTNDPYFYDQWQLHNNGPFTTIDGKGKIKGSDHTHVAEAWQLLKLFKIISNVSEIGNQIRLGLIDDGFDIQHEDLKDKFVASKNFGGPVEPDNMFAEFVDSGNFHGTMVTGIAAASTNNGVGIAGACPGCKLVGARMSADTSNNPNLTPDQYYDQIFSWILEQNTDIVNCSWGPDDTVAPSYFNEIIEKLTTEGRNGKGMVMIFASGNSNEDFSWNKLASHQDTISVGACNSSGERYSFSNHGSALDLISSTSGAQKESSWGTTTYIDRIWTTDNFIKPDCLVDGKEPNSGCSDPAGWTPNSPVAGGDGWWGKYSYRFSHTSAAAPLVSGIAGLVLQANPDLTSSEVKEILTSTADKTDEYSANYNISGHSNTHGFGRVNALRAVAKALFLAGKNISETVKNNINESSPCTVDNCWDFIGETEFSDEDHFINESDIPESLEEYEDKYEPVDDDTYDESFEFSEYDSEINILDEDNVENDIVTDEISDPITSDSDYIDSILIEQSSEHSDDIAENVIDNEKTDKHTNLVTEDDTGCSCSLVL